MNNLSNTNNDSLLSKVYLELENSIINGVFEQGAALNETKLSKELGVSRTPIREALRMLEQEGLVKIVPNRGAVVIGVSKADINDIYTVRMFIEGLCAKRACEKISSSQLDELEKNIDLQEFYAQKGNTEKLLELDGEFHKIIYEASDSRILKSLLTNFHHYSAKARELSMKNGLRKAPSINEHKAIFEAIKNKNQMDAEKLTKEHITNAKKNVTECLNQN